MNPDKYVVFGPNGEIITLLNRHLAERQKIPDEQLEALKMSHQVRYMLFKAAETVLDQPLKLRMLAGVFDALESEQQELWNFSVDPTHNRFFDFPGCTCPKIDNAERLGVEAKIYVQSCPIHGWEARGIPPTRNKV